MATGIGIEVACQLRATGEELSECKLVATVDSEGQERQQLAHKWHVSGGPAEAHLATYLPDTLKNHQWLTGGLPSHGGPHPVAF